MPDRLAENLMIFIRQNTGRLPAKRRDSELQKLRDDEVVLVEGIVNARRSGSLCTAVRHRHDGFDSCPTRSRECKPPNPFPAHPAIGCRGPHHVSLLRP
jgi:hypothetical protein